MGGTARRPSLPKMYEFPCWRVRGPGAQASHGADGADALQLQGFGQYWSITAWRARFGVWGSGFGVRGLEFGVWSSGFNSDP
jgi:hypothetical protein